MKNPTVYLHCADKTTTAMIKTILSFILATIITSNLFAQDKSSMKAAADSICNCLNKIKTDELPAEKVKELAMECFTTSAMEHYVKLAEERGIEITDEDAMQALGVEIGKELLKMKCSSYMKVSVIMAGKEKESQEGIKLTETVHGKLLRIENKDFVYVILKDDSNKEHSLLWFEYFPGSEKFTGEKLKTYIGKKITATWIEKEVYLPKAGGYFKIKEITNLESEAK